jgi:hypothetical protein
MGCQGQKHGAEMRAGLAAAACSLIVLSGCAGTDAQLRGLERDGIMRIDPAPPGRPYDYVVRITKAIDIGWNSEDKATRDDTAMRAIRTQCPAGRIVGEDVIEKGSAGRGERDYLIQIRCAG